MIVSTKGRYALRVLVDLARNGKPDGYITLDEISERQQISEKYLEAIISLLVKGGLVKGVRGKGGGYALKVRPDECSVGRVLEIAEGSIAPVVCLEKDAPRCPRADICPTLSMWSRLNELLNDFFSGITIADLADGDGAGCDTDFCI